MQEEQEGRVVKEACGDVRGGASIINADGTMYRLLVVLRNKKMKIDVTAMCRKFLCICTKDLHKFRRRTVWYLRAGTKSK